MRVDVRGAVLPGKRTSALVIENLPETAKQNANPAVDAASYGDPLGLEYMPEAVEQNGDSASDAAISAGDADYCGDPLVLECMPEP